MKRKQTEAGIRRAALVLPLALLLAACSNAAYRLHSQAIELGFQAITLRCENHLLASFFNGVRADRSHPILHVYLEGDGRPFRSKTEISADPTPSNPLMLRLMKLDSAPSLYLARPCYNGHAQDAGCDPSLWTSKRYGPTVVTCMADGLKGFLAQSSYAGVMFFGHSGGGALAMLLAGEFPDTSALVTLAGNLDIDAWADHHGYDRLSGSLHPDEVRLGRIPELHFLGAEDKQVPPVIVLPALAGRTKARVTLLDDVDHHRGWEKLWPEILNELPELPR